MFVIKLLRSSVFFLWDFMQAFKLQYEQSHPENLGRKRNCCNVSAMNRLCLIKLQLKIYRH